MDNILYLKRINILFILFHDSILCRLRNETILRYRKVTLKLSIIINPGKI